MRTPTSSGRSILLKPPLRAALAGLGLLDQDWQALRGGRTASATIGSEDWIVQERSAASLRRIEALRKWLDFGPGEEEICRGADIEIIAYDSALAWTISRRVDTVSLYNRSRQQTEWERFCSAWPTMIELASQINHLGERFPPPADLAVAPANDGTVIRAARPSQLLAISERVGIDLSGIGRLPAPANLEQSVFAHGDLNVRNLVRDRERPERWLPIDWEMLAYHPLGSECTHAVARHLIKAESAELWPEMIDFFWDGLVSWSERDGRDLYRLLFWGTLADAIIIRSVLDRKELERGLRLIAERCASG